MAAASMANYPIMKSLLAKTAIDLQDTEGKTALMYVVNSPPSLKPPLTA